MLKSECVVLHECFSEGLCSLVSLFTLFSGHIDIFCALSVFFLPLLTVTLLHLLATSLLPCLAECNDLFFDFFYMLPGFFCFMFLLSPRLLFPVHLCCTFQQQVYEGPLEPDPHKRRKKITSPVWTACYTRSAFVCQSWCSILRSSSISGNQEKVALGPRDPLLFISVSLHPVSLFQGATVNFVSNSSCCCPSDRYSKNAD